MPNDLIEFADINTPKLIKVIGVGGGGGNAVGRMYRDEIPEVRYLITNTDSKALSDSPIPDRLQLGPGLGAGGDPKKGKFFAEENVEKIREILDDETRMVFITAGMGGGTGTGASPVIAREARAKGILTIGIVTIPFLFEREKQIDKALDGLEVLAQEVDAMLVINNERLCEIYPNLSIIDAFKRADQTLSTAVRSITEIIAMHGKVGLDFEDVRTTLTNGGVAVMSSGYAEGEMRVTRAIEQALHSPLLNNNDVYNADRILLAITTDQPDGVLLTGELDEVTAFMQKFDNQIHTKWGLVIDPELGKQVKITILASGFGLYERKKRQKEAVENKINKITAEQEAVRNHTETAEASNRRNAFYNNNRKVARHISYYLFSDDDLRNEQLVEQVAETPTYLRTRKQWESICRLSNNTDTNTQSEDTNTL